MKLSPSQLFLLSFILAGIFALLSAYQFIGWLRFKDEYEKAYGVVVKNKIDKEKKFYPVIRFKTLDNQKIAFTAVSIPNKTKYNEGDTIMVYYDLLNAEDVHIAGEETRLLYIFLLLTALFGFIGGYGLWQQKQQKIESNHE
jgi:cytochrome c oxidase assembly protein Cox11